MYLRGNGYVLAKIPENEQKIKACRQVLTVTPTVPFAFAFPKKQFCFLENDRFFVVPKCYGLAQWGVPTGSQIALTTLDGQEFNNAQEPQIAKPLQASFHGTLTPEQADTVEKAKEHLIFSDHHSCIVTLSGGSGKTVLALYLAANVIKQRTLIVVHKEFLMDQWTDRIRQFCGPDVRIGRIQQDVVDVQDFTIAMIQSLRLSKYPRSVFESFGFLIVDECHHASAQAFSQALFVCPRTHALGLSATPHRKDGLTKVFQWHLGPLIECNVTQERRRAIITFPSYHPTVDSSSTITQKITRLLNDPTRNQMLIDLIGTVMQDKSRRLLVLSERRQHLQALFDATDHPKKLLFMGGSAVDQETAKASHVIFGTYAMACLDVDTDMCDYRTGRMRKLGDFKHHKTPVLTASGHLSIPTAFDLAPEKPCVRVTHERGTLVCSTDHPLMLFDGSFKKAQDLTTSDRLKTPGPLPEPPTAYVPPLTDQDLTLLAFIYGRNICRDVKYYYTIPFKTSSEREQLLALFPARHAVDIFDNHLKITNPYMIHVLDYVHVTRFPPEFYRMPRHMLDTLVQKLIEFNPTLHFVHAGIAHQVSYYMWRLSLDVYVEKTRVVVSEHTRVFSGYFATSLLDSFLIRWRYQPGSRVLNVTPVLSVPLCDIAVPDKNFLASGVFVHNSEGLDLKHLNTLLLASPRSDIAQSSWRVFRDPTTIPWIIDVQDKADLFYAQARKRRRFYDTAFSYENIQPQASSGFGSDTTT